MDLNSEKNEETLEKSHLGDDENNCHANSNSDVEASTPAPIGSTVEEIGESNVVDMNNSLSPVSKGFGLKKWRRIRRDIVKDPSGSVESKIVLKRGLSNDTGKFNKSKPLAHDIRHIGEDNNVFAIRGNNNNVGMFDGSTNRGSGGSDCRTDSENSEDRSSKSSSVTSKPRFGFDIPPGSAQEKRRARSASSKNSASSTRQVQHLKGGTGIRNEPEREEIKMEKENSHFSTSLSGSNFEASDGGKHDGRSFIHGSYCNENEDHPTKNFAANLSSDVKEEQVGNSSTLEDPLISSLCILQSIEKALEEEIQKLGVMTKVPLLSDYDSMKTSIAIADLTALDPSLRESYISDQSVPGGTNPTYSSPLEHQVLTLTHDVSVLENKLSDIEGILELKDCKINELEVSLRRSRELPEVKSGGTIHLLGEEFRIESEFESFFRQKIEAEIEYVVITRMTQNFKVVEDVQHKVLEELETSSERQEQVLNKLEIAESKAAVLKNKADTLGNYCDDILEIEETFMMQKRLFKVTLCFFVQFMLLIMGFLFFVLHLLPSSVEVIPT